MTSEPPEEIWFIHMIQPRYLVSMVRDRGYELALVDSGSRLVACPVDYAPEVPLLRASSDISSRSMVNATGGLVEVFGRNEILYVMDNGEELMISWNVSNVNCLILAGVALQRGGATLVLGPETSAMHTAKGGYVDLVREAEVPWLPLRCPQHL